MHRRTVEVNVFWRDDYFAVIGTLRDERPWAGGDRGPRQLHVMELGLVVRRADMVIVDAAASMETYPHAECRAIEPKFTELIGLCVARGYTSAVQERFGRERGCSHLEFLARAIGPAVIQAVPSSMHWRVEMLGEELPVAGGGEVHGFSHQLVPRLGGGRGGPAEGPAGLAPAQASSTCTHRWPRCDAAWRRSGREASPADPAPISSRRGTDANSRGRPSGRDRRDPETRCPSQPRGP